MSQRGSASIIVVSALALGGIVAAFSADLSRVIVARSRAQTAADAAALGAAQELLVPSGMLPDEVAADLAQANGGTLVVCRCDSGSAEAVVTVEVEVNLPLLAQDRTVRASARAVIAAPPGSEGLDPSFVASLSCLFEQVDGLWIVSGFRTRAEQAALYEQKPNLAAPPGSSNHELGLAADLGYPSTAVEWAAHAAAPSCGLGFPVPSEPWHVEPVDI
ncbi:MAG TPA: Rv3654c family TadE-like protein [Actinomycetota bacterium]|nr:Rv3654c family TadE-like protein [Actinomycetota bacterium]